MRAMLLGMAGYLVPFMFVNQPALLLIGDYNWWTLIIVFFFIAVGFFAIGAAVTRWLFEPLRLWQQII